MPRKTQKVEAMTEEEWRSLPITFGVHDAARVLGCCVRYAQNHAEEFGGHLVGGKWLFSKPLIAEIVGLER